MRESFPDDGKDSRHSRRFSLLAIIITSAVAIVCVLGVSIGVVLYKRFRTRQFGTLVAEEIDDFFNTILPTSENYDVPPYNPELECKKEDFRIDENNELGAGQFGVVYQATLTHDGEDQVVAAKTNKSSQGLKDILSEIRILGYIGKHQNIVSIIAAYTAELYEGKIYAFTEFCSLGSLEDYLPKMKSQCKDELIDPPEAADDTGYTSNLEKSIEYDHLLEAGVISKLVRWSQDICCGMEFLASKCVVHGDLATRNVLLTEEETVKITDFGLSRKFLSDKSYAKSNNGVLPWKWICPESLRSLKFNKKSDVWAFGVTLWEIFSCGEQPYEGHCYGEKFIYDLEHDLRLPKPEFSPDKLYAVMQECWNLSASERPTFSELKSELEKDYLRVTCL